MSASQLRINLAFADKDSTKEVTAWRGMTVYQ